MKNRIKPIPENFDIFTVLSRINVNPETECWNWMSSKSEKGYGLKFIKSKKFRVHRLTFHCFKGFKDQSKILDHICKNTSCVNPDHLREVSHFENSVLYSDVTFSSVNHKKTKCKNGHDFNEKNTIIEGNRRICIICYKAKTKRNWLAYKERKQKTKNN
ncbi:MAG: HNH endonuclease [Methanobacterium sp.]